MPHLLWGVNVRVPAGWAITQEGVGIFGGFAVNRRRDISPDPHEARPFFIGGLTVFGGVSVDEV